MAPRDDLDQWELEQDLWIEMEQQGQDLYWPVFWLLLVIGLSVLGGLIFAVP